jgi:mono/diheme cytochrome c family protein
MRFLVLMSLLAVATSAGAAGDPKTGKLLHDKHCIGCHAKMFGGDGTNIYTRSPRLINDKTALAQRVAMCAAQAGAKWLPEDEADVVAYLNQQFYKFK